MGQLVDGVWRETTALGTTIELRCGRWQEVLAGLGPFDSMISDPPFSHRTHDGRRTGSEIRQSSIEYGAMDRDGAMLITHLASMVGRWVVLFGDHITAGWYREDLDRGGLYVFQPVPWCKPDCAPRMSGDGPASAVEHVTIAASQDAVPPVEWLSVARAKSKAAMLGSVRGYYIHSTASTRGHGGEKAYPGTKPLGLMRQLIRDYSRPNDLIVDPFAGSGTTLIAARLEGRSCIGAEMDPNTFALAVKRLEKPYTLDMDVMARVRKKKPVQGGLF